MTTEEHPLKPFLPAKARVLMLGSFPPQRSRWSMDFFYPNYINDMWRIMGHVFYKDRMRFVDEENRTFRLDGIRMFLEEKGIALFDTATSIIRTQDNASDKFLEVVRETDLGELLSRIPDCKAIVTTGEKASSIVCSQFGTEMPKMGEFSNFSIENSPLRLYRMPSSSRAYPMRLETKASYYEKMFKETGIL